MEEASMTTLTRTSRHLFAFFHFFSFVGQQHNQSPIFFHSFIHSVTLPHCATLSGEQESRGGLRCGWKMDNG